MDRGTVIKRGAVVSVVALVAAYGCERPNPYKLAGDSHAGVDCPPDGNGTQSTASASPAGGGGSGAGTGSGANTPDPNELDERVVDYSEALRTASLKLVGTLPDVEQVYELADEPEDARAAKYEAMIDDMLADPRFAKQMVEHFRTEFKMFGAGLDPANMPTRETAPIFAARIVVEDRPWTDLVMAGSDTCPTFDPATSTFTSGDCGNTTMSAGVLSDPGIHNLYYGNFAFRRNRFFHEYFLCKNANQSGGAEPSDTPSDEGPGGTANEGPTCGQPAPANYTSPWPMSAIAGGCNGGRVNFHEWNTTVVCANCHATWNHRAPIYAEFDELGVHHPGEIHVHIPVEGSPMAVMEDFLPAGQQQKAWKFGTPVDDVYELGQAIAADPEAQACAVKRMWNFAMSRGDIVINESPVPDKVVQAHVESFVQSGFHLRTLLRDILLSEDFVSF
jgi:hypothetical protein